jgi:alpha-D-ribose 1-methylphosphonate 5-triphosphate synthase subunit PhnH
MPYDPGFDDVRESQQVFRRLLDATAWPGRIEVLPGSRVSPPEGWPAAIVQLARTLLDAQVTFAVHGLDGASLTDYVVVNTGARSAPIERASYVVAGHPFDRLAVSAINPGTLLEPDRGATLILACPVAIDEVTPPTFDVEPNGARRDQEHPKHDTAVLSLRGRGIADERSLQIDRAIANVLRRISEREDEYPLGVDVILADPAGRIVSLPRTTRWSMEASPWGT